MPKRNGVYFNKKDAHGNGKYRTGQFISTKNNALFTYRSSYEFAFYAKLEADNNVVQFIAEPFNVPYVDSKGKKRIYKPDLVILYKDGSMHISEIKPKSMLRNLDVQCKAAGCRAFIKLHRMNASYHFITEEDIFSSMQEYLNLLKSI